MSQKFKPGDVVYGPADAARGVSEWEAVVVPTTTSAETVRGRQSDVVVIVWRFKDRKKGGEWIEGWTHSNTAMVRHPDPDPVLLDYMKWLTKR